MKRNMFKIKSYYSTIIFSIILSALSICLCLLIEQMDWKLWLILMITLFLLALSLIIIYLKPAKLFTNASYLFLDNYILAFSITFLILSISSIPDFKFLFKKYNSFIPFYIFISLFSLSLLLFVFRLIKTKRRRFPTTGILYLKDAKEGKYEDEQNKIQIVDEPVNYDLLNNSPLIDKLTHALTINKYGNKTIVGVIGKWGAGKTTFIKNTLKRIKEEDKNNHYIICQIISAWKYEDARSAFASILEEIYKSLNIGVSDISISKEINNYINGFLSDKKEYFPFNLFYSNNGSNSIINVINDYLMQNNKQLIFVVDNLDRGNENVVRTIISTIYDALDIKNSTFVYVYDEEQINNLYANKDRFMDKIINYKIYVPSPSKNKIYNIGSTALDYYLQKFKPKMSFNNLSPNDLKTIRETFNVLDNLRALIIALNNLFNYFSIKKDYLNFIDYFAIETIKLTNYKLFDLIKNNPEHFVFAHKEFITSSISFIDKNKANEERKDFINKYFGNGSQFEDYSELVNSLFPSSTNSFMGGSIGAEKAKEAEREQRIYSGKFFEHYIGDSNLGFIDLINAINKINESNNEINMSESYKILFAYYSKSDAAEILKTIESNLPKDQEKLIWTLHYFEKAYKNFDDQSGFASLSSKSRCAIVISEILCLIDENVAKNYIESFKDNVESIVYLSSLSYWNDANIKYEKKGENLKSTFEEIIKYNCKKVLSEEIDVYEYGMYDRGITWRIRDNSNEKATSDYLQKVINENNVFCFLNDFVIASTSTNEETPYSIYMKKESFNNIYNIDLIKTIVDNATTKNNNEHLIKQAFETMLNNKSGDDELPDTDKRIKFKNYPYFIDHFFEN